MSELINNSQERVDTLAGIIRRLHAGTDPESVKQELAEVVQATTSDEIVAMEQQLMDQGMSVDEVKSMCDLHSQLLGDLLDEPTGSDVPPGHPLHTFGQENVAIADLVGRIRGLLSTMTSDNVDTTLDVWQPLHEQLMDVEKHYSRKENILFPYLERHGVTGPSQVMWGKDDDIRVLLKSVREALTVQDASFEDWRVVIDQVADPLLEQVEEMIRKEERILFPMAKEKLSDDEWAQVHHAAVPFGTCLVEAGTEYRPEPVEAQDPMAADLDRRIPIGAGSVLPAHLEGIVKVLPVDLTYVDADDRVAFFSEGPDRVFERTRAIIGRKVQNCHPPHSVSIVDQILRDFRSGAQDVAEFWIELGPRFIHIRYFAVRDETGEYLGTLEVTQDATHIRRLDGQRRLLQYEEQA